jgi:hypothetical protein
MPAQSTSTRKTCAHCRQDCSKKARMKDPQGRYYCKECFEVAMREAKAAAERRVAEREPEPELLAEIVPEEAAGPVVQAVAVMAGCPDCGKPMPAGSVLCTACGYDSRQGRRLIGAVAKVKEDEGKKAVREADRSAVAKAYLVPLGIFAVSVGLTFAFLSNLRHGQELGTAILASYAVTVPVGLVVFWILSVVWFGVDAPLHIIALRLAAVYATGQAVNALFMMLTGGYGGLGIVTTIALYTVMHMVLLELEKAEAIVVSVLTLMAQFAAAIGILTAMKG